MGDKHWHTDVKSVWFKKRTMQQKNSHFGYFPREYLSQPVYFSVEPRIYIQ